MQRTGSCFAGSQRKDSARIEELTVTLKSLTTQMLKFPSRRATLVTRGAATDARSARGRSRDLIGLIHY